MKNYYPKKTMILGVKQLTLLISLLLLNFYAKAQAPDFDWVRQSQGGNYPNSSEIGNDVAFDSYGNKYVVGSFKGSITFGNITLTGIDHDAFIVKYDPFGIVVWAKETAGIGSLDIGNSLAVDGSGNSYITGAFQGSITLGSTALTSSGNSDVFVAKYDPDGVLLWAKQAGGTGSDRANGIGVDGGGNSYLTGYFQNSATFGGNLLNSNGSFDVFIAKYDPSGTEVWAKSEGGTNSDRAKSIAVDAGGNSYIIGDFYDITTIGSTTLTSNGTQNIFIAKYNHLGILQWAKQTSGTGFVVPESIAVDVNGFSYITGHFYRRTTFGSTTLNSSSSYDVFIAKYNPVGTLEWAKQAGGAESEEGNSIAVHSNGDIFITGNFRVSTTFGSIKLTSSGGQDVFIAKYNPSGTVIWAKNAGGTITDYDYSNSIAVNVNGYTCITGRFEGSATFGSTTLTSSGEDDIFIAEYNPSGAVEWATNPVGSTVNIISRNVAVDAAGNSYLTGAFQGSAIFGGTTLTSSGNEDIFIAKYNPSGTVLWAKSIGGTGFDRNTSIAVDGIGNSYITATFQATVNLGNTTLVSSGGSDVLIAKFDGSGNVAWAKSAGGTGIDYGNDIAVDVNGKSYITGYFRGSATFGSFALNSGKYSDVFVAKYDPLGNVEWARKAGGADEVNANSIALDGFGNSYITGYFRGGATFGNIKLSGNRTQDVQSGETLDIFIAKYNDSGTVLWAKKAGGTGNDRGNSIAVAANGYSYITGYFTESATFGITTLTSSGNGDVFVAKYDPLGIVDWARSAGGTVSEVGNGIAIDGYGYSYITGSFQGSSTFGSTLLTSIGSSDVFVANYNAAGILQWAKSAGGTGSNIVSGNGIAVGVDGSSYITGSVQGSANFGSTTLTTNGTEAFIAKINAAIPLAKYALPTAGTGSNGNVHDVNAYPNPFTDKLMMDLTSETAAETAKVTLNTIDGKTVYQKVVKLTNGRVSEVLDGLSKLPAGMYFLTLQADDKPIMLKVLKQ